MSLYKFIDFNDEKTDSFLMLELTDLARTLAKNSLYETEIQVHSYLDKRIRKVYVSQFWNHRPDAVKKAGMKSDVFLRALGNDRFTNFSVMEDYRRKVDGMAIPKMAKQLFMLAEDLRIEELCKRERPGMRREFTERRQVYNDYFQSQLKVNLERNLYPDALFNFIYLYWNLGRPIISLPSFSEEIDSIIPRLQNELIPLYDSKSTQDIAFICLKIVELVERLLQSDMINEYFHLPHLGTTRFIEKTFDDLTRKDPLQNDDAEEELTEQEQTVNKEEMKTWHREVEKPGGAFLQFQLDQGTKTGIEGGTEREGEEGDQALAIVQGKSGQSSQKDYSSLELSESNSAFHTAKTGDAPYGKANKGAHPIFLKAKKPTEENTIQYEQLRNSVLFYQLKLKNIIDRTLEKKKTDRRTGLQRGRLNKNLLSFYTDEQPKLFYKKAEPGKELDAVFSLLIDCSASMLDKMEETKRGITLFHEALKAVEVPHEVIGFWEDAFEATSQFQPNYFFEAISFSSSLAAQSGPEITQLEAKEDNRDGFAIKIVSDRLLKRNETQKFLIVFSDGEPAATGYDNNGLVDTHEAVVEARKKGIEVFNIFLSDSGVEFEQKKVFENIYGNRSITAPYVEELPDVLFPLLKRLLNQAIYL